ncbi:MAG: 4Fe-4S dicluster domain-containing protein [Eubacteriaceae bacterium]|jgi:Na+-translocating ferredoxin:NAD+ oxidoreductase RnfC subunit
MEQNLVELARNAGIVGAGGAGFPTAVKLDASCDTVIVNGAECEPLLRVDQQLMVVKAEELLEALNAVVEHTGAKEGVIGLKKKYVPAINRLNSMISKYPKLRLFILENFYPAGDEQTLVYEVTGKSVPEGGIPLNVGALVMNVETLLNLHNMMEDGTPVTDSYITVTGAVRKPLTIKVPLGITATQAIDLAGGATVDEYTIINGGPMMGKIVSPDSFVTKTTKGYIVLPSDHKLIESKTRPVSRSIRDAAVACMQCSLCTEVCPRHRLGHNLEPHKLMRIAAYGGTLDRKALATTAFLCCDCGLCQHACVMDLQPWKFNQELKRQMSAAGIKNPHHNSDVHAIRFADTHRFDVHRLIRRLGLDQYDVPAPLVPEKLDYTAVTIPLSQHIGAPSVPVVQVGDTVSRGQLIGDIPEGKLGAKIFASIDGVVTDISGNQISISAA